MNNSSVALGKHFKSFIDTQVQSGRYQSASEVMRAGLRLLEIEENKREALIRALIEGEQSGFADDFDKEALLASLHKDAGLNGR